MANTENEVTQVQTFAARAEDHLARGDLRAAIRDWEALEAIRPDAVPREQLARAYRKIRDFRSYCKLLRRMYEDAPDDVRILRQLAEGCRYAHRYRAAARYWEKVHSLTRGKGRQAVLNAIACHRLHGDRDGVERCLKRHRKRLDRFLAPLAARMVREGTEFFPELPAGLYLVTGNNGTGKTTAGKFLETMGYRVVHADVELAEYRLGERSGVIRYDVEGTQAASQARFWWPDDKVARIREGALADDVPVFIVGGAFNARRRFSEMAVAVFRLLVPDTVLVRRLDRRSDGRWRQPETIARVLKSNKATHNRADAFSIRTDRPVHEICHELLSIAASMRRDMADHTGNRSPAADAE